MKLNPVPPLPGQERVFELLAFLLDPKAVDARLKELEAARQDLNRRIGAVDDLGEIENLKGQAQSDREAAARELKRAREEMTDEINQTKAGILRDVQAIAAERAAIASERAQLTEDKAAHARAAKELQEERKNVGLLRVEADRLTQKASGFMEQARKKQEIVDKLLSQSKEALSA